MRRVDHTCHAHGCTRRVEPKMLMCRDHWFRLRKPVRDAIWAEYREGQEKDKRPSLRYMAVQQWAIAELLQYESADELPGNRPLPGVLPRVDARRKGPEVYFRNAHLFRQRAIEVGAGDPLAGLLASASGSVKRSYRCSTQEPGGSP